jgi:hypothetical protein
MTSVSPSDQHFDVDKDLWVINQNGELGYITTGSPRIGRFYVFWSSDNFAFLTALFDLRIISLASSYWLQGFLSGQAPPVWFAKSLDMESDDPRTKVWASALQMFQRTGVWRRIPDSACISCRSPFFPDSSDPRPRALPSDPLGEECFTCHPVSLDSLWPTVSELPPIEGIS